MERQELRINKSAQRESYFLPRLVLLATFSLGVAIACKNQEANFLHDASGDGLITTADYCIINDNELPCADTNRDGVVDIDDRDIIATLVGTISADTWRDPTGDGRTDCDDQRLVQRHLGKQAPLQINGISNEKLASGYVAKTLEIKFKEGTPQERIGAFYIERNYSENAPPDSLPFAPEFRQVNVRTNDLAAEIEDLSQEPIVDEVHLAWLARPIVDFPATPATTCQ